MFKFNKDVQTRNIFGREHIFNAQLKLPEQVRVSVPTQKQVVYISFHTGSIW